MLAPFEIGHVAVQIIWAEDVSTAATFYRDVLGLSLIPDDNPAHAHMTRFRLKPGILILLHGTPRPAENAVPPEFPLFALTVNNLDNAVEQLKANKVALPQGVEGSGRNRWVMFRDPAGNLIELVQAH